VRLTGNTRERLGKCTTPRAIRKAVGGAESRCSPYDASPASFSRSLASGIFTGGRAYPTTAPARMRAR